MRPPSDTVLSDRLANTQLASLGDIVVSGGARPTGAALALKLLDSLAIQAGNLGVQLGQAYQSLPLYAKYGITALGFAVDAAAGPIGFAARRAVGYLAGKTQEAAATFISGRFLERGYSATQSALGGSGALLITSLVLAGATAAKGLLATGVIGRSVDRFKQIAQQLRPGTALNRSVFELPLVLRGNAIEKAYGQNLHQNFPVIDKFDGNANSITSIKSLDLGAKSYANTGRLQRLLEGYADDVGALPVGVKEFAEDRVTINSSTKRVLEVVVPSGASAAQLAAIKAATSTALQQGVVLKLITLR